MWNGDVSHETLKAQGLACAKMFEELGLGFPGNTPIPRVRFAFLTLYRVSLRNGNGKKPIIVPIITRHQPPLAGNKESTIHNNSSNQRPYGRP